MSQIQKPKLSNCVHLPLFEFEKYLQSKYQIPKKHTTINKARRDLEYYDMVILDSHMFRGNDSSKNFFNQFMTETAPTEIKDVFSFLDSKLSDFIFNDVNEKPEERNKFIVSVSEEEWIKAYIDLINNAEQVIEKLGKENEYYLGYMFAGLYESAAMSSFGISDYWEDKKSFHYYFWYITW